MNQPADIFIRELSKAQFQFLKGKLGIMDIDAPTWEGCQEKFYHIFKNIFSQYYHVHFFLPEHPSLFLVEL